MKLSELTIEQLEAKLNKVQAVLTKKRKAVEKAESTPGFEELLAKWKEAGGKLFSKEYEEQADGRWPRVKDMDDSEYESYVIGCVQSAWSEWSDSVDLDSLRPYEAVQVVQTALGSEDATGGFMCGDASDENVIRRELGLSEV